MTEAEMCLLDEDIAMLRALARVLAEPSSDESELVVAALGRAINLLEQILAEESEEAEYAEERARAAAMQCIGRSLNRHLRIVKET